jgi:hypothetical protein
MELRRSEATGEGHIAPAPAFRRNDAEMSKTPVTVISVKLLGHSSIAVTSRYLDHLSNGEAVTFLEGVRPR